MEPLKWWQTGVVYQIYPRSFQDTDGDGVGDLEGIIRRLDYLVWLGVDALWLSPIYPSPMADFGYDISDFTGIDPLFGALDSFDHLIAAAHARGLRVILDFVPNHTSDRHPWFLESRSGRHNPKRDWYLWRDPGPGGGPPNNWRSRFGGNAWTYDRVSGQYYCHSFLPEQPDLNWRNREVRGAMYRVLRFWLDRGVDGFRVDVISSLIKDDHFRDNPINPGWQPGQRDVHRLIQLYSADRPEVHDIITEMRALLETYPGDRVLIGEIYLPIERLVAYYGADLKGVHLPFNFQLIGVDWDPIGIARIIREYESALPEGGWPNWVLGNHDQPRIATRVGPAQARVAAMLLLTLRGTPTLYYGDELGMEDVPIPPERIRDPWALREPGFGRDGARTPMPWDPSPNGGFTTGQPWLPLAADHAVRCVKRLASEPRSTLSLYRQLLALRRAHPALVHGRYVPLEVKGRVLAYMRQSEGERAVVALNFGPEPVAMEGAPFANGRVLLSTELNREPKSASPLILGGNEGVILIT
ncbi:MAG: DUF3459 domain-containing protein [Acetobacteraceae bacterium]|nr:DUF3459 domain-containing protein [Acetobacteraceae bacterium]